MSLYSEAIKTVQELLDAAGKAGEPEPTAMTLATADAHGRVSARIVLLKQFDEHGAVFYTNYDSAKAAQLAAHAQVALCLHWKVLRDGVQVRIEGTVERIDAALSDEYFATRPRASQIGAWASLQSQTLPARADLDARIAECERQFADKPVPRPPNWGGYRVAPDMIEIWYGQRARLHDRVRYERIDSEWAKRMLYP
jgi:pyridoxamine 5'-phosphate oxidase